MYDHSHFTQPQVGVMDLMVRQMADYAGFSSRDVCLADEGGFPVWRRGERAVRAVRPTATQATLYVTEREQMICNPWPGLMHRLEWPAERIVKALFELDAPADSARD